MKCSNALVATACTLMSTTLAHITIFSPVPYGNATLNNSPLLDDGSDFPCKQRPGVYDITQMNNMVAGEDQILSFTGDAVHGGGSCQVSVTLDKQPTKNSQWKVIHSIIGGCPSNVTGNLVNPITHLEEASGHRAAVFNYTIPKGMPNGQYTLAWTWHNKVGNREMYMNCAPITVTGGGNDNSVMEKLPDMFVANIPFEKCSVPTEVNFQYPNPGDSVETRESTAIATSLIDGGGCASMTKMGAGAGTLGKAGGATQTGGASSAAGSQPAATNAAPTSAANTGGVFAPNAASSGALPTSFTTLLVTTTAGGAAAPSVPVSSAEASGVESAPSASSTGVTCSSNGAVVCMGTTQFGICNNGVAIPQALAAGTTCSNGAISKRAARRIPLIHRRQVAAQA